MENIKVSKSSKENRSPVVSTENESTPLSRSNKNARIVLSPLGESDKSNQTQQQQQQVHPRPIRGGAKIGTRPNTRGGGGGHVSLWERRHSRSNVANRREENKEQRCKKEQNQEVNRRGSQEEDKVNIPRRGDQIPLTRVKPKTTKSIGIAIPSPTKKKVNSMTAKHMAPEEDYLSSSSETTYREVEVQDSGDRAQRTVQGSQSDRSLIINLQRSNSSTPVSVEDILEHSPASGDLAWDATQLYPGGYPCPPPYHPGHPYHGDYTMGYAPQEVYDNLANSLADLNLETDSVSWDMHSQFNSPPPSLLPFQYSPPPTFPPPPFSPPFSPHVPPPNFAYPPFFNMPEDGKLTANVDKEGFIIMNLKDNIILDISSNMAIRVRNRNKDTTLTLSGDGNQLAMVHPKGRVLQYGERIEIQCSDKVSVKNAKIYPRGVSFTANNCALVYLLDQAGARTTSELFHDLYENNVADALFEQGCEQTDESLAVCTHNLDACEYWKTGNSVSCWSINGINIQQTSDGLVVVDRSFNNSRFTLKASPSNGKVKIESTFLQVTASLGEESHVFIRSWDRRLHYNGGSNVFTVRNAGHAAGFDEGGFLRIF